MPVSFSGVGSVSLYLHGGDHADGLAQVAVITQKGSKNQSGQRRDSAD